MTALAQWIGSALGTTPNALAHYERALTSAPANPKDNYQRLEFLGDRVLGLLIARWLFELYPDDREGALSHRYMQLVSGAVCADVARTMGVRPHLRLNKQGIDDGLFDNDNLLGDVAEALICAVYLDQGIDAADALVRRYWANRIATPVAQLRSPKSLLHEWADRNKRKSPQYRVVDRSGPDHAPRFLVEVAIPHLPPAQATGRSKQEAEIAAASAMLASLSADA